MPVLKIYKNGMWEDVSASSSVDVDSSLSIPGMAADAKITGDAINSKEQKIYKQNDEPVDAPDGTIWIDLDAEGSSGGGGSAVIELDTSLTVSGMAAESKAVGDALANKSDNGHNHNDLYFTASEVDTKINTAVHTEQARAEGIEAGLRTDVDSIKTDVDSIKDNTLYATDTNKDGNVELIFGAKLLITFNITSDVSSLEGTYQAESGMTWRQWCDSSYNTIGANASEYDLIALPGSYVLYLDGDTVHPDDAIINNKNYVESY